MTRLLVWRHGRTAWNAEHRFQGQTDVDLDETGVRQAVRAAPRLAAVKPDLIISSDLSRATSTATRLAELTGLPVGIDARLRERHFGPWQGLTAKEIEERYPDDFLRWGAVTPIRNPDIESVAAMTERVTAAFRDAITQVGDGTAVLVTHGGAARLGCGTLLGWPADIWHTLKVLDNCRATDLRLHPVRGWQLHAHNQA
jgi:glucosyl-3-phosphoglycerate phosphatase